MSRETADTASSVRKSSLWLKVPEIFLCMVLSLRQRISPPHRES